LIIKPCPQPCQKALYPKILQKNEKPVMSKLNFRRGRHRAREKQREKECDADEERKIISCPLTWFYQQKKNAFKTS